MKKSIFILMNILIFQHANFQKCLCNVAIGNAEILIYNVSGTPITVTIYPASAIFSGLYLNDGHDHEYSFSRSRRSGNPPEWPRYNDEIFITGGSRELNGFDTAFIDFDDGDYYATPPPVQSRVLGGVSFGLWKIVLTNEIDQIGQIYYLDYRDFNLGNYLFPFAFDIYIRLEGITPSLVKVFFDGAQETVPMSDSRFQNKTIKIWDQIGRLDSFGNQLPPYAGSPNKGSFKSSIELPVYENYPIDGRDFGAVNHENLNDFSLNLNMMHNGIHIKSDREIIFKNSKLIIGSNINFSIGNNSNITFINGIFKTIQASGLKIITIGNNSSFIVQEDGSVNLNNTIFQTSSGSTWNGIKLENSGYDTIINCTFNNAKTAVSIIDNILSNHPNKTIRKNTFNISQDNGRGIDVRNQNKILVDSNTFNFSNSNSTLGIFFRNSEPPNAGALQSFYYNLNIVNNKFYNGYLPVYISGLTSARTPFYVYNNTFYGTNTYSIVGLKVTGDIKNNSFDANNNSRSAGLWNSNPNVFGNSFNSVLANMYLNYSFPSLAPYQNSSDQLVWTGGRNSFTSSQNENIYLAGLYPYLNKGNNNFTINDVYHIFGSIPDSVINYYMEDNCWNGYEGIPNYYLYKYINDTTIQNISADYTPVFCDEVLPTVTETYTDKGSEIIDTTLITEDFDSDPVSGDESLLAQARTSYGIKDFPEAIINYKGLVNNFPGSEFIYTSLYEMYDNYSALDTSADQSVTDVLFGDLKQYLESKITAEIYDNEFNSIAYDIILMCETRMRNLETALTGYEFLALYHPDAEQRMLASWDYEEIEEMLNGSGGGEKQLEIRKKDLGMEELEINELLRLDELIDDDPLMKALKKNYDKNIAIDKSIKSHKVTESKLIQRAKENIFKAKFLQKEEKEKRYMEDLKLMMTTGNTDAKEIENINFNPTELILNQNYPNPFNPTTNISYSIPVSSFVTLKVFDITGKEIVTLVNEYKQNGSYQVTFNGINLPSGVYYFRLNSGDWNQVRKMLLIK